jgi:hypothetical protein
LPNNHGHSVDAHFHDGVESLPLNLCPVNAANTVIVYINDQIAIELPDLQAQNLMMLC